jgi:hypothetical protein
VSPRLPAFARASTWGAAQNDLWSITDVGLVHWDGRAWMRAPWGFADPPSGTFSGSAPDDVWLTNGTRTWHWNGKSWASTPLAPGTIVAVSPGRAWSFATDGPARFAHWDGTAWVPEALAEGSHVVSLAVRRGARRGADTDLSAGGDEIWMSLELAATPASGPGRRGALVHVQGGTRTQVPLPDTLEVFPGGGSFNDPTGQVAVDEAGAPWFQNAYHTWRQVGGAWLRVDCPGPAASLAGLVVHSASDVWIVRPNGDGQDALCHWDGTTAALVDGDPAFHIAAAPRSSIDCVGQDASILPWGHAGETWVVDGERVFHWNAGRWVLVGRDVPAAWGLGARSVGGLVWALGPADSDGAAHVSSFDGTTWTRREVGGLAARAKFVPDAFAVAGTDDVWVAGQVDGAPRLLHSKGGVWTATPSAIAPLDASAPDDVWGRTPEGGLVHFDGTAWSASPLPAGNGKVFAFQAVARGAAWALAAIDPPLEGDSAGFGMNLLVFDGAHWATAKRFEEGWPDAGSVQLSASGRDDVFVIPATAGSFHWDGTAWTHDTGTAGAIWTGGRADAWALSPPDPTADAVDLLHYDGARWGRAGHAHAFDRVWRPFAGEIWGVALDFCDRTSRERTYRKAL